MPDIYIGIIFIKEVYNKQCYLQILAKHQLSRSSLPLIEEELANVDNVLNISAQKMFNEFPQLVFIEDNKQVDTSICSKMSKAKCKLVEHRKFLETFLTVDDFHKSGLKMELYNLRGFSKYLNYL